MADEVIVRVQRAWPLVNPQITKLPMLQDYRQDAMTLFWETDGNLALHEVDWGRTNVSEHTLTRIETVQIDSSHFMHRATLTGLAPETSYVYRVRSGTTTTFPFSFRTAPLRDTPFAVAWWGDSQENPSVLGQLIPSMVAHGVDWMGVAGDLASSGASLYDWHNYWFKPMETQNLAQSRPALFAHGNHDGEYPFSYAYSALPGNEAWYAFDYGNSRFIFLDTEASTGAVPEQYDWLANELARPETQNAAFRVVCFHKPPYCNLWNGGGYAGETWVRNDWVPLFQQYHVDAVINGHSHCYDRGVTNGVTYLIVGGGGGGAGHRTRRLLAALHRGVFPLPLRPDAGQRPCADLERPGQQRSTARQLHLAEPCAVAGMERVGRKRRRAAAGGDRQAGEHLHPRTLERSGWLERSGHEYNTGERFPDGYELYTGHGVPGLLPHLGKALKRPLLVCAVVNAVAFSGLTSGQPEGGFDPNFCILHSTFCIP